MTSDERPPPSLWDQLADKNRRFAQLIDVNSRGSSSVATGCGLKSDTLRSDKANFAETEPEKIRNCCIERQSPAVYTCVPAVSFHDMRVALGREQLSLEPEGCGAADHSSEDGSYDLSGLFEDVEASSLASNDDTSCKSSSTDEENPVITVETSRLTFHVDDPEQEVKESLKLRNSSKGVIVFKIKTTNPYLFDAQPSIGFLYPGEVLVAAVILHEGVNVSQERFLVAAAVMPDFLHVEYLRSSLLSDLWRCIDERHIVTERIPCTTSGRFRQRSRHLSVAFKRDVQEAGLADSRSCLPTGHKSSYVSVANVPAETERLTHSDRTYVDHINTPTDNTASCRTEPNAAVHGKQIFEAGAVDSAGILCSMPATTLEASCNFNDNANLRGWLHKDIAEEGGSSMLRKYFSRMRQLQAEAKAMIKRLDSVDERMDAVVPQLRRIERAGVEVATEMSLLQERLEVLARQAKRYNVAAAEGSSADLTEVKTPTDGDVQLTSVSISELRRELTDHVESFNATIENLISKHSSMQEQVHEQDLDIERLLACLDAVSSSLLSDENFSSNAPARGRSRKLRTLHDPSDSGDSGDFATEADSDSGSKVSVANRSATLAPAREEQDGRAAVQTAATAETGTSTAMQAGGTVQPAGSASNVRKLSSVRMTRLELNQTMIGEQLANVNADLNILSRKAVIMTDILRNLVSEMKQQKKEFRSNRQQLNVQPLRISAEPPRQEIAPQYPDFAEDLNVILTQRLDKIMDMTEKLSARHRNMTNIVNHQAQGVQKLKKIVKLLEKGIADEHEHILMEHAKNKAMLSGLADQHNILQHHAKNIHAALRDLIGKSKVVAKKVSHIRADLLEHKQAVSRDMHVIREEAFGVTGGDAVLVLRDKLANIVAEVKLVEDAAAETSAAVQELSNNLRQHREETSNQLGRVKQEAGDTSDRLAHEANKLFAAAGRDMTGLQERLRALDHQAHAADDGLRSLKADFEMMRKRTGDEVHRLAAESARETDNRIKELLSQQAAMKNHVDDAVARARSLQDHHGDIREKLDALHADMTGNVDQLETRLRESTFQMAHESQARDRKTEAFRGRAAADLGELKGEGARLQDKARELQVQLDDTCGHIREQMEKLNSDLDQLTSETRRECQAVVHDAEERMARHDSSVEERLAKMEDQLKDDCESWIAQLHRHQLASINSMLEGNIGEVETAGAAMDSLERQLDRSFYALVLVTVMLSMLVYTACIDRGYVLAEQGEGRLSSSLLSHVARSYLRSAVTRSPPATWSQWFGLGTAGWKMDQM